MKFTLFANNYNIGVTLYAFSVLVRLI